MNCHLVRGPFFPKESSLARLVRCYLKDMGSRVILYCINVWGQPFCDVVHIRGSDAGWSVGEKFEASVDLRKVGDDGAW